MIALELPTICQTAHSMRQRLSAQQHALLLSECNSGAEIRGDSLAFAAAHLV